MSCTEKQGFTGFNVAMLFESLLSVNWVSLIEFGHIYITSKVLQVTNDQKLVIFV